MKESKSVTLTTLHALSVNLWGIFIQFVTYLCISQLYWINFRWVFIEDLFFPSCCSFEEEKERRKLNLLHNVFTIARSINCHTFFSIYRLEFMTHSPMLGYTGYEHLLSLLIFSFAINDFMELSSFKMTKHFWESYLMKSHNGKQTPTNSLCLFIVNMIYYQLLVV